MKVIKNRYFILFIIVILGFILRTYNLSKNPYGFFADEASIGYNAYNILTKGVDEYKIPYPIFFKAFGEYKSPIEIYSTAPFITIFGLNELSIRLTSVFYGTLSILMIFFLVKELFIKYKFDYKIGLFSSLILAISPWHIHFSRISFELMPFCLFTMFGVYLFLRTKRNINILPFSIISFILAIYSYSPARIFIPLFSLSIVLIYGKFLLQNKIITILNGIILLFLLLPLVLFTISPSGLQRWNQVNIFSQPSQKDSVIYHIANNYISHFSLNFLFLKGDIGMSGQTITRHSVKGIGELYLFQFPIIVIGAFYLIKLKEREIFVFLSLWLILYPIGSIFTAETSAQATRSIIGVIPFQILSAIGLYCLLMQFSKLKRLLNYICVFSTVTIVTISLIYYLNLYFVQYPLYSSDFWGWQYGARDIIKYFIVNERKYDQLIMAPEFNAPEIFFKFYAPDNCSNCIVGTPNENHNPSLKQLFAVTPYYLQGHPALKFNTLKRIIYPNQSVAFQIGEVVQ
jgi:4-amino-4-deoxy-L-arabinose transferase-like glycosyltransferase